MTSSVPELLILFHVLYDNVTVVTVMYDVMLNPSHKILINKIK